jgi:hypothetical protein
MHADRRNMHAAGQNMHAAGQKKKKNLCALLLAKMSLPAASPKCTLVGKDAQTLKVQQRQRNALHSILNEFPRSPYVPSGLGYSQRVPSPRSPFRPGSALPLGESSLTILGTSHTALMGLSFSWSEAYLLHARLPCPRKAHLLHGRPELPHGPKPQLRRRSKTAKRSAPKGSRCHSNRKRKLPERYFGHKSAIGP